MNRLEFIRDNGSYAITDFNDERLFCIGQVINSDKMRAEMKKNFEYSPELGFEEKITITSDDLQVHISPLSETIMQLVLRNKRDPKSLLETDIKITSFLALIDDYEQAVDQEAESIILTREQDTFSIAIQ